MQGEQGAAGSALLAHNFKRTFSPFLSKPNPPQFAPGENGNIFACCTACAC